MTACISLFIASTNSTVKMTSQATLTQFLNFVFQRIAKVKVPPTSGVISPIEPPSELEAAETLKRARLLQNDAFVVFEKLCQLASAAPSNADILASKALALQLLLSVRSVIFFHFLLLLFQGNNFVFFN
jgi:hypothetical protein